jgi:hypothetical protein
MKKNTVSPITAAKLFLKITAAEAPLVFLRGKTPACVDVSEWLMHVCIEADDHGISGHVNPTIVGSATELEEYVSDLDGSDLIVAIPEGRSSEPAPYIKLARKHNRDVIIVDVGTAGEKIDGVEHVAVTESITDEDWYAVAAEVERATTITV